MTAWSPNVGRKPMLVIEFQLRGATLRRCVRVMYTPVRGQHLRVGAQVQRRNGLLRSDAVPARRLTPAIA